MRTTTTKNRSARKSCAVARPALPTPPKPTIPKSRMLPVNAKEGEMDREIARMVASHLPSALVAVDFGKASAGELSLMETIAVLKEKADAVNSGSLKEVEALLMNQAIALNIIFGELARRAALNMGEYLEPTDKYLRLALKAQGQCRATLETLAAVKNPPVVFAKQANIAGGHQQINNGTARAVNSDSGQNELLKVDNGERLDDGTAGPPIGGDPAVASLETVDRP
jgi:hypothetical protein